MAKPAKMIKPKEIVEMPAAGKGRLIRTLLIIAAAALLGFLSLCFFVTRRLADFYFSLMAEGE